MHVVQKFGLLLPMFHVLCVCVLNTFVSPTETNKPSEVPFGMWTRVGPKNHGLAGGPNLPQRKGDLGGMSRPVEKYKKYPE